MKNVVEIRKTLLNISKAMELEVKESDLEIQSLFRTNDFGSFDVSFKGSMEGVIIFVEKNYKIYPHNSVGELIDDSLRIGINPWPYSSMKSKVLKKMKKFILEFAKKYPSAIIVWGDDGSVIEKVSEKYICHVMNEQLN